MIILMEIQKTAEWVHAHAGDWQVPLLLMHGSADAYSSVEGSRSFARNLQFADVEFIEYPGAYHDLSNDSHREQVYADVETWLEKQLRIAE